MPLSACTRQMERRVKHRVAWGAPGRMSVPDGDSKHLAMVGSGADLRLTLPDPTNIPPLQIRQPYVVESPSVESLSVESVSVECPGAVCRSAVSHSPARRSTACSSVYRRPVDVVA